MILWILLVCLVAGVGLYFINKLVPMQPDVKQLMNVLVIIAIIVAFAYALLGGFLYGPYTGPHYYP